MLQEPLPQDAVFWINATDPASLCGLAPGPSRQGLPPRIASTWLVYRGERLVMVAKRLGKGIEIFTNPDDRRLPAYFMVFKDLLGREFNPVQKIIIETVNSEPVLRSPYADALRQFGFKSARNTLELWREF